MTILFALLVFLGVYGALFVQISSAKQDSWFHTGLAAFSAACIAVASYIAVALFI